MTYEMGKRRFKNIIVRRRNVFIHLKVPIKNFFLSDNVVIFYKIHQTFDL